MEQRALGREGLAVPEPGLGRMGISEFYGAVDGRKSVATIHRAIELGVSFLDTADMYVALGNKSGWVVLSTGNESETSVGYSTLYGDMADGFAAIRDAPKPLVYRICRRINERKGREVIQDSTLNKEPFAELRPDQRDVDSLPSYDVLDPILEAYVEDDKGIREIKLRHNSVTRGCRMAGGASFMFGVGSQN